MTSMHFRICTLMFTPSIDAVTFDAKCKKDYCQAIFSAKYGLRVVQAARLIA